MLVSIQKVRLKSDFVLTYLHALLSSTVSAIQRMRTCAPDVQIDAHVCPCRQIRAVNAGLLHHRESGLIPCAEGLRENYWLLASVSRSRCRWESQPRWRLAREGGGRAAGPGGTGEPVRCCHNGWHSQRAVHQWVLPYAVMRRSICKQQRQGWKTKCAVNVSRKS